MKPMMQLSHLVVCMLNSSWSKKRVEATELPKHRNTSVARQNSGHRLSPHFPLHGMYPAQQTYLDMSLYRALLRSMYDTHGPHQSARQQYGKSAWMVLVRSECQRLR
jgi:hypothetical protein